MLVRASTRLVLTALVWLLAFASRTLAGDVQLRLATFEGNLLGCTQVSKHVLKNPKRRAEAFERVDLLVCISNGSAEPVDLFRHWNSWGYFSVQFIIRLPDGTEEGIAKKPRPWTKNYPATFRLLPGCSHVIPISFTDQVWRNLDVIRANPKAQIRAVFRQDKELPDRLREYPRWKDVRIFDRELKSPLYPIAGIIDPDSSLLRPPVGRTTKSAPSTSLQRPAFGGDDSGEAESR